MEAAWKHAHAGVNESKILAEMQGAIFENGGGDYPANEFIIGSGKNALLCQLSISEKRNLDEIPTNFQLLNGQELTNIIILQCSELFRLEKLSP